jgi:hypothetical protein
MQQEPQTAFSGIPVNNMANSFDATSLRPQPLQWPLRPNWLNVGLREGSAEVLTFR